MVLDTNVFVAGLLTQGVAAQVLDLWLKGRYTLLTSSQQMRELRRVLRQKFPELPRAKVGRLLNLLEGLAEKVTVRTAPEVSSDEDDNLILAIALKGRADFLVTGDKSHLLGIKVHGVRVIGVREFLERMR
ncbi:putative toxin-antitoxin system toxin component, PIN family [Thermus scotoductus]|uniref:putative toxin-antitoxin system toxin component, PIN family n=1 Tax=Thermus scotoductus TaxID=37636 RepID=UPI002093A2DB|nr:putative toxin-antitoxin system toxin component, PIN family [Thermus scotoductus]